MGLTDSESQWTDAPTTGRATAGTVKPPPFRIIRVKIWGAVPLYFYLPMMAEFHLRGGQYSRPMPIERRKETDEKRHNQTQSFTDRCIILITAKGIFTSMTQ